MGVGFGFGGRKALDQICRVAAIRISFFADGFLAGPRVAAIDRASGMFCEYESNILWVGF
jgi:hypothetical protein